MATTGSALIVGAGPAGAMLAYLLCSRGVPTTLIERQADFTREFRGEGLTPGGQAVFRQAGLWDDFAALPQTRFERAALYFRRRRFATLDFAADDAIGPRWVSQPALLEMLVEKCASFADFRFLRGVPVAAPLRRDGRVCGVELAGGEPPLEADYVFGCDGRLSTLRRAAGLDQPRNPESFDIVWCKVDMPSFYDRESPEARGYVGGRHLGLFLPAYDGLLQVGWIIPKGGYRALRERGIESWIEQIAGAVSDDLAEHLRRNAADAVRPFLLDVVCDCFERWSIPGLALLGDAAHPMSPVGAQGINIALRDAVVAANRFVPLLLRGADARALDRAAADFQRERLAEVKPIQALQRRAPKLLFGSDLVLASIVWPVAALHALGILGWVARRFDLGPRAFAFGVTDVDLEI